jgi:hypothetical protein
MFNPICKTSMKDVVRMHCLDKKKTGSAAVFCKGSIHTAGSCSTRMHSVPGQTYAYEERSVGILLKNSMTTMANECWRFHYKSRKFMRKQPPRRHITYFRKNASSCGCLRVQRVCGIHCTESSLRGRHAGTSIKTCLSGASWQLLLHSTSHLWPFTNK